MYLHIGCVYTNYNKKLQSSLGGMEMILNFLKKFPAGMMIVPLIIGACINTFCPDIVQIGGLTTATFSNAGAATAMGIQLFCLGTTLRVSEVGSVFKRGGSCFSPSLPSVLP